MSTESSKQDWSWVTESEFDEVLEEIVEEEGAAILSIGDVSAILREHFNNAVLARLAEKYDRDPETGLELDPEEDEDEDEDDGEEEA